MVSEKKKAEDKIEKEIGPAKATLHVVKDTLNLIKMRIEEIYAKLSEESGLIQASSIVDINERQKSYLLSRGQTNFKLFNIYKG